MGYKKHLVIIITKKKRLSLTNDMKTHLPIRDYNILYIATYTLKLFVTF